MMKSPLEWETLITSEVNRLHYAARMQGQDSAKACKAFVVRAIEEIQSEAWKQGVEDASLYVAEVGGKKTKDERSLIRKWLSLGLSRIKDKHDSKSFRFHYAYLNLIDRS